MSVCTTCGRELPAEELIYSRHTGARYCRDMDCGRRGISETLDEDGYFVARVQRVTDTPDYADEESTGQLALGVPGEQRALEGLAKPGIPAPTTREEASAANPKEAEMHESYALQEERETWEAISANDRPSTERAGYRRLTAKYAGKCDACAHDVAKGEAILYNRRHELRLLCEECGARADAGENLEHNGPPRPTTRERLERRAERRREWAASRETKADNTHVRAHELADRIPFGQPILVGHHSEGRHRRDAGRIESSMRASVENAQKAREHESAARGIEGALRTSIYDDDPDAIERLEEKLQRLEAERDRWKTYNATVRKPGVGPAERETLAHDLLDEKQRRNVETLERLCPYQLGKRGEVSYTNLSANINRNRKRLEELRRQKEA